MPDSISQTSWLVPTLGDVATFFGVALQTVRQWRSGPDALPGEPGRFDLAECARWRIRRAEEASRKPKEGSKREELEDAKLALDVSRRKLLLQRLAGELVEVDAVARLFERSIAEHNAQADQLKDRLLMLLPEELTADDRRRILAGTEKAIEDMKTFLADAAADWARETETARG